jgi:hypothetical protein
MENVGFTILCECKTWAIRSANSPDLKNKNPGPIHEFPIILFRIVDEIGSGTLRVTVQQNRDGVNIYDLGLLGYIAIIKVDKRPTPQPIGSRVLAPGKPLIIGLKHSGLSLAAIKSNFFH